MTPYQYRSAEKVVLNMQVKKRVRQLNETRQPTRSLDLSEMLLSAQEGVGLITKEKSDHQQLTTTSARTRPVRFRERFYCTVGRIQRCDVGPPVPRHEKADQGAPTGNFFLRWETLSTHS